MAHEYRYFIKSIFLESINYLFQFIETNMTFLKNLKLEDTAYQKELIIITSSAMEKIFYYQEIDADIKQYEKIRKSALGQGED